MGLSTTLSIAQSALSTNAALSTILSRNIAGVNDPNYATKSAELTTTLEGGAQIGAIRNAADDALFTNLLSSKSNAASSAALSAGLSQLEQSLGLNAATAANGTASSVSPATLLATLTSAFQSYSASPSNVTLGQAAVSAAKALAAGLNDGAAAVQNVRGQADKGIASAVATINTLLDQFGQANRAVVDATLGGADATSALDQRNAILSSLSEQIGISTAPTGNGGLAIYTDGGATLFQATARTVAFTATSGYGSGTVGNGVTVDGVPVTGPDAVMTSKTGKIAGLAQLRDSTAVAYGNQLDQMAQSLIASFAETDQRGGSAPPIAGLFMAGGTTAIPTTPTGLAGSLAVSASVDPTQGGSVTLLRDGGINAGGNAAYTANATGAASYADRLNATLAKLDAKQTFDAASGGAASGTLAAYAASSVAWLEAARQDASTTSTNRAAVVTQTAASLSSATGVNLDQQLAKMLDLEHSYHAAAELMTTVKTMLDVLLAAIH